MTAPLEKSKVLLLGDWCYDTYHYCEQTRLNPEAPVPLITPISTIYKIGMAANVETCLKNLGIDVFFHSSVSCSEKVRYVDTRSGQQLIRIDEDFPDIDSIGLHMVDFSKYSAVVISDYNKGTVTDHTIREVINRFEGPIFLDTKKPNLKDYAESCIIKINEHEAAAADSVPESVFVTMGARGVRSALTSSHWPSLKVSVVDTCGAGDAFLAGLTYGWLLGDRDPVEFAVVNAAISVQHQGTYAPTLEELNKGLELYDAQRR